MNGVERCKKYSADVIGKKILAPKTIIQACERFERDFNKDNIYFDEKAANVAVSNIERLPHAKGRLQGQNIKLEDWQCFFVCNLFGWKWKRNDLRRFRRAYELVPRKNGKSLLAICIALNMFGPDMEPGAEVYLGATSQGQAEDLLFNPAKYIVEQSKSYRKRFGVDVNASNLIIPANFSKLKAVIKNPDDGYNPHCAVVDEYHEHDTDDQYSTFDTGMGSREQPLLLVTSTAGSNLAGPCKEMHDDCISLLDEVFEDDSLFVLIYQPDEDDKWDDINTLIKVNPNIGVSVSEDYLIDQQNIAKRSSTKQNAFRTKHCNEWVGAKSAWMNMLAFQARRKKSLSINDFKGKKCFVSFDLASKVDVACRCVLIHPQDNDDKYYAFFKHYLPEEVIFDPSNEKYKAWHTDGWIESTPGNVIDYSYIEDDLKEIAKKMDVEEVPYDPFQATQFSTRMMAEGLKMVEVGQTVRNFSDPMKEIEKLVLEKKIEFEYDPVIMWMFGNVVAKMDKKDNIFPNKERVENKIDGVVALIMAMNRALAHQETGGLNDFLSNPVSL